MPQGEAQSERASLPVEALIRSKLPGRLSRQYGLPQYCPRCKESHHDKLDHLPVFRPEA
jgi:hypothetical protein